MAKPKVITVEEAYETVKPLLKERDGKIHLIVLRYFYNMRSLNDGCPFAIDDYTRNVDAIISAMQDDGYEIVDIKPANEVQNIIYAFVTYK